MNLSDPFVAFDLETTGVDPFSALPVSYAIVGAGLDFYEIVNPGIPIPPSAMAIHGITDEMASHGNDLLGATQIMADGLIHLWKSGHVLVGMNVSYDLTILSCLCKKFNEPFQVGAVLDILVLDRHYDKFRKGRRNLASLCKFYGVSLGDAHNAKADAQACLDILTKMRGIYPFDINLSDNALLRGWYQSWLWDFSCHQVNQGKEPIPKGRYEWPVHSEDS